MRQLPCSCFGLVRLLLLLLVCLPLIVVEASLITLPPNNTTAKIVTLYDYSATPYEAQKASFGNPMDNATVANIMFPPDDVALCDFPAWLGQHAQPLWGHILHDSYDDYPIALLVSDNNCTAEQKARVALEIQQNVTSALQYLIVYNGDPEEEGEELIELHLDNNSSEDVYQSIGIMYISRSSLQGIANAMVATVREGHPRLLWPGNDRWRFLLGIDMLLPPTERNGPGSGRYDWVRYVLFSLLVIAPFGRAAYLWYAGGGRCIWRRNENGRIVGIQYVP